MVETRAKAIILMRQLMGLKKVIDQGVRRKDEQADKCLKTRATRTQ